MTQTPKTLTRIPRFLIATFLIGLGLPLVAMAQKAGKPAPPTADMAVTTTVRDADANIAPVLQIRSDGALYSNTSDVQSLIQGIGDWVMQSDFSTASTRTVFVDFSQPIAGSCPSCANGNPVALPSRLYGTRFIAKCHEYNNNMFTLPYLSTISCPLYTRVDVNGQNYRINMNPLSGAQAYYPETNYVNMTCTRLNSSGKCNSWQIEPSGTYVPTGGTTSVRGNVGKLVKVVTVRGRTTDIDQGDFYFSFSIGVTNP